MCVCVCVCVCVFGGISLHATGLARTLFMENRSAFVTSIDLQKFVPPPPVTTLTSITDQAYGFEVAFRSGRVYALQLTQGATPRARPYAKISTALVSGGSKVRYAALH